MLKKIDELLGRLNAEVSLWTLKILSGLTCHLPGHVGQIGHRVFMMYTSPEYRNLLLAYSTSTGYFGGLYHLVTVSPAFRKLIQDAVSLGQDYSTQRLRSVKCPGIAERLRSGDYNKVKI